MSRLLRAFGGLCLVGLIGCSVAPDMPDPPASHPASPAAERAPRPEASATLRLPDRSAEAAPAQSTEDR